LREWASFASCSAGAALLRIASIWASFEVARGDRRGEDLSGADQQRQSERAAQCDHGWASR
jgi:hypothetical protein